MAWELRLWIQCHADWGIRASRPALPAPLPAMVARRNHQHGRFPVVGSSLPSKHLARQVLSCASSADQLGILERAKIPGCLWNDPGTAGREIRGAGIFA